MISTPGRYDRVLFYHLHYLIAFVLIGCASSHVEAQGEDSQNEPTISTALHDAEALASSSQIALFLSGEEAYHVSLFQDALSLQLQELGWDVVNPTKIETALEDDLQEFQKGMPDSIRADPAKIQRWSLTRPLEERPVSEDNEVGVAALVDADAYVTGILLFGRQQYTSSSQSFNASADKIVITAVSLQINDVEDRNQIFQAVIGYINGKSAPYVAEDIRTMMKQYRTGGEN